MYYWLALVVIVIVGLAHWIDGRVNPKAYCFLPFLFLAPSLTTLDLSNSLGGLGVALVLMGSVAAYIGDKAGDKAKDDRDRKRMTKLAIVGFGATIVGAAFTYCDQIKSDNKSEAAQDKITSLGEKNVELSEENRELLKENTNLLTGGNSLFYIKLNALEPGGKPQPFLAVFGEHSIPQVALEIMDSDKASEAHDAGKAPEEIVRAATTTLELGAVVTDSDLVLTRFPYPDMGKHKFLVVTIVQRKHVATQLFLIWHTNSGSYRFASRFYRVTRSENGEPKYQLMPQLSITSPGLKLDENGKLPLIDYPEAAGIKLEK